jgi:tRNA dimethylallyltransferase
MQPQLVILLGPTGVGKSEIAVDMARQIDGEIINADSQQVYRHMNIGTAKPSMEQRKGVPHHLLDVIDPDENFDAARFRLMAWECAREIESRGKRAVVCGGTGLYLRALTRGLFSGPSKDAEVRHRLEREAEEDGLAVLYERLRQADPEAATRIHPNDRRRMIRALEVFALTGRPISQWQKAHAFRDRPFKTLKIGLNRERKELYARIDRRCDAMIAQGFIEEVRTLMKMGYGPGLNPLQSVGYRQMGLYLRGAMNLEDAVREMKRDTRRLAKRQLTWFRPDEEIRWFHPETEREEILRLAKEFFAGITR